MLQIYPGKLEGHAATRKAGIEYSDATDDDEDDVFMY